MATTDNNLVIYEQLRVCPAEAQKPIASGRLKGKTDINPMWRIKELTRIFGPCGFGWTTKMARQWIETNVATGEQAAFVEIELRVKVDGEWSEPIVGLGGSMFVSQETKGMHTSDEAYKMAYTDAISVACKALGMAADIYWAQDATKYEQPSEEPAAPKIYTLRESFFDKRDRLENLLSKMSEYYHSKPDSFTILRFLKANNIQCESEAVLARLQEIWLHHISEIGL